MKVSVIIPTYKRPDFLSRAIDSVLNQDYPNIEIIVVDDNGYGKQQEYTKHILNSYPSVKLVTYPENKGACFARNEGGKNATGDIIMFLDDDDYYLPNKIKIQAKILEDHQVDACLCAMKRKDQYGNEIFSTENTPRGLDLKSYIIEGNCFTTMIAIKRKTFMAIGGFSEIPRFQDKFFMYKFHKNHLKVKLLDQPLFVLTEHDNERVSLGNISKITSALNTLYRFEKLHFDLFSKKEQIFLKNRYYYAMAQIRTNAEIKTRLNGLFYLIKSNPLIDNQQANFKLFTRLIFSDKVNLKLKNKV